MATHDEVVTSPDRRVLWRWAAEAARAYIGWILIALGALSIFLGWYGVSGQSLTAKQLPYLISGGVTGIALIIVGAVFLATDNVRRQIGRLQGIERKVDDLYALLVVEPTSESTPAADGVSSTHLPTADETVQVVALPTGTTYHRPTCSLIAGKSEAVAVDGKEITTRGLTPCPVCDPPPPPDKSG
jgi:hypothetical protein